MGFQTHALVNSEHEISRNPVLQQMTNESQYMSNHRASRSFV
jgi:hypothetical protein